MIALDSLRTDGMLLVDAEGQVCRADPIVLLGLDLLVDLGRAGLLVFGPGTVRIGDQVTYQPVGLRDGHLVLQRVELGWSPRPRPEPVPIPPGPCPHPQHQPCPCNLTPGWRRS